MIDQKLNLGIILEQNKRNSRKSQIGLIRNIPPIFQCSKLESYNILFNVINEETKRNEVNNNNELIENSENSYTKKDTGIKSINDSKELKEPQFERCPTSSKIQPSKFEEKEKEEEEEKKDSEMQINNAKPLTNNGRIISTAQKYVKPYNQGLNYNTNLILSKGQFHLNDSLAKNIDFKLNRYVNSIGNLKIPYDNSQFQQKYHRKTKQQSFSMERFDLNLKESKDLKDLKDIKDLKDSKDRVTIDEYMRKLVFKKNLQNFYNYNKQNAQNNPLKMKRTSIDLNNLNLNLKEAQENGIPRFNMLHNMHNQNQISSHILLAPLSTCNKDKDLNLNVNFNSKPQKDFRIKIRKIYPQNI